MAGVPVTVDAFTFKFRERDPGPYTSANVNIGRRRVQLTVSPTERTFHVHVDGVRWRPDPTQGETEC